MHGSRTALLLPGKRSHDPVTWVVRIMTGAKAAALELELRPLHAASSTQLPPAMMSTLADGSTQRKGTLYRDIIYLGSAALLVYMYLSPFLCLWQALREKSEAGVETAALQRATAMLHAVLAVQK